MLVADALLTEGALFPAGLGALVASDVDVFAGEELGHLGQHILQEVEGLLLTGTHHDVLYTPDDAGGDGLALAGEFGVGGDGGELVAGELDFGYHGDEALGGIGYHLFHLLLGVVTAVLVAFALNAA